MYYSDARWRIVMKALTVNITNIKEYYFITSQFYNICVTKPNKWRKKVAQLSETTVSLSCKGFGNECCSVMQFNQLTLCTDAIFSCVCVCVLQEQGRPRQKSITTPCWRATYPLRSAWVFWMSSLFSHNVSRSAHTHTHAYTHTHTNYNIDLVIFLWMCVRSNCWTATDTTPWWRRCLMSTWPSSKSANQKLHSDMSSPPSERLLVRYAECPHAWRGIHVM